MTIITLDPSGALHGGLPTYPWRAAPAGYATRRQLRVKGLRPAGGPDAQILRPRRSRRGPLVAYLYRETSARPVRPMIPALWRMVRASVRARQTCGSCSRWVGYVPPLSLGRCLDCAGYPKAETAEVTP